jgi:heat shock protein HslJ
VTGFYTGDAIQSPVAGSALTLEFADDRASGNSGCNTFDGDYKLSGLDRVTLGPFRSTLRACTDPAVGAQEQQYLHALELAVTYRVSGSQLTLFRRGGSIAATFQRATGLTSGS